MKAASIRCRHGDRLRRPNSRGLITALLLLALPGLAAAQDSVSRSAAQAREALASLDENISRLARVLDNVLGLMESLDMETAQYRQQLITVTGQISSEFLDVSGYSARWPSAGARHCGTG